MSLKKKALIGMKKAVDMRDMLSKHVDTSYGGERVLDSLKKIIHKQSDRLINARGKGIRFIRVRGRIVPVRGK